MGSWFACCFGGAAVSKARCTTEQILALARLPGLRGRFEQEAELADLIWFRTGGRAQALFEPADKEDLIYFVQNCPQEIPLLPLGLGSNMIIRDGGVPGIVIRLGKAFSFVMQEGHALRCGAGTPGILVASQALAASLTGLEFMRGIPGTVGGAVRMNAGAYGREVADILVACCVLTRAGDVQMRTADQLGFSYRHSALEPQAIVLEAVFEGVPGESKAIQAEMTRIANERETSQPLRSRTGGSTFKNPPGQKAWQLIDAAGCRGLRLGGAQVSLKHTNFLINADNATSSDLEALGETVRARVLAHSGISLEWEIERIGDAKPQEMQPGQGAA
jgi:UDP-N-acetylmuramate dehydrogenase